VVEVALMKGEALGKAMKDAALVTGRSALSAVNAG